MISKATKRLRPIEWLAIGVSLILIVLIGIKVWQLTEKGNDKIKEPISNSPLDIVFGSDTAKLTIYAYMSYHCGYCRLFFTEVFPELEREFIAPGRVRLVLKLVEHSNNTDR